MFEKKESCGLFGIFGDPDAVQKTFLGLYSLQHRGQESAGIASSNGEFIQCYKGMGTVGRVFRSGTNLLKELANPIAIGHVRYSTTGSSKEANSQPLLSEYSRGQVAVAHNGNLINAALLRDEYEAYGSIFKSTSDTEIIIHLLAKPTHVSKPDPLAHVLNHLQGAYCLLFLYADRIEAARDPYGIRPLCLGQGEKGVYVVASESCAFDAVGAKFLREIMPGEIVRLDKKGLSSRFFVTPGTVTPAHCIFEHIYFAKQNSTIFGENVHEFRKKLGRRLAIEQPAEADVIIPVPDSGTSAAIGYAEQSKISFDMGMVRSHYIGRTFISPDQKMREAEVKLKLAVVKEVVEGKSVAVVDDSIVRGTTTRGKIRTLREAGAKQIHMRVSCPPIRHPCFYGVDFPTKEELLANNRSLKQIKEFLEVDSVGYMSLEGLLSCAALPAKNYCTACWSGKYPIPVDTAVNKYSLEHYQMKMFDDWSGPNE
ncbi:MAG: amidophosphoribosyltransferase [Sedimentisphaerales bacterium]|nr:amidophosphoribosyltransferase [Sedimentisphaerales bacterium]